MMVLEGQSRFSSCLAKYGTALYLGFLAFCGCSNQNIQTQKIDLNSHIVIDFGRLESGFVYTHQMLVEGNVQDIEIYRFIFDCPCLTAKLLMLDPEKPSLYLELILDVKKATPQFISTSGWIYQGKNRCGQITIDFEIIQNKKDGGN